MTRIIHEKKERASEEESKARKEEKETDAPLLSINTEGKKPVRKAWRAWFLPSEEEDREDRFFCFFYSRKTSTTDFYREEGS
ncbi:hypothetical protein R1flu_007308 [Riccia fluitans]|uniref:Uncharacterized protein n=1 Tax=Riccia fluitans TaxID=41844 RepID=A0ABD1Z163_9MARC